MKLASVLATITLAAALASPVRAEVWGYVDEKGVPHFASERLDERYELFFRGESVKGAATVRAVAVPTAAPKLIAFFEVSPDYKQVQHHLRAASRTHRLDIELLKALIATESGFDATAVSPKGAVGLMQIMPVTAQRWGVTGDRKTPIEKKLSDPEVNIKTGTRHLRYLMDRFPGQTELVLAAYNAGEGAVIRAGRQVPNYRETQNYVQTVLQLYEILKPPAALGGRPAAPRRTSHELEGASPVGLAASARKASALASE